MLPNGLKEREPTPTPYVDPHFVVGQTPGFMVFPIHRWRVSLPWCGSEEIDCETREEAITEFNRRCGVRSTESPHQVEQLF